MKRCKEKNYRTSSERQSPLEGIPNFSHCCPCLLLSCSHHPETQGNTKRKKNEIRQKPKNIRCNQSSFRKGKATTCISVSPLQEKLLERQRSNFRKQSLWIEVSFFWSCSQLAEISKVRILEHSIRNFRLKKETTVSRGEDPTVKGSFVWQPMMAWTQTKKCTNQRSTYTKKMHTLKMKNVAFCSIASGTRPLQQRWSSSTRIGNKFTKAERCFEGDVFQLMPLQVLVRTTRSRCPTCKNETGKLKQKNDATQNSTWKNNATRLLASNLSPTLSPTHELWHEATLWSFHH